MSKSKVKNLEESVGRESPEIFIEEDRPFVDDQNLKVKGKEESLTESDTRYLEALVQVAKQNDQSKLKTNAFVLIVICLAVLLVLYTVDVFLVNKDFKNSELLNPIFELVKYISSALVGFLFASNANKE